MSDTITPNDATISAIAAIASQFIWHLRKFLGKNDEKRPAALGQKQPVAKVRIIAFEWPVSGVNRPFNADSGPMRESPFR